MAGREGGKVVLKVDGVAVDEETMDKVATKQVSLHLHKRRQNCVVLLCAVRCV